MSFLEPEICESAYWSIETTNGTHIVPVFVQDMTTTDDEHETEAEDWTNRLTEAFADYVEGKILGGERSDSGFVARLSASGYLDCTEWNAFETENEARRHLLETYGNDEQPEDWERELYSALVADGLTLQELGIDGLTAAKYLESFQIRRQNSSQPIPFYDDDSTGKLYVWRHSQGIGGIVRAESFEAAYRCFEDELFPDCELTTEELEREFSTQYLSGRELWLHQNGNNFEAWRALTEEQRREVFSRSGQDVPFDSSNGRFADHPVFQEEYGFRNCGTSDDACGLGLKSAIYSKDVNGDHVDELTESLFNELELRIEPVS